jgi:hypothetical protein
MACIGKSAATLRISGDDLVPEDVSILLGSQPTTSYRKGDVKSMRSGGELKRKTGSWSLQTADHEPENLDMQVAELLGGLTQNLDIWVALSQRFKLDLFCGLFMECTNEGLSLSPETLRQLGVRGIEIGLDIYAPIREVMNHEPCPRGSGRTYGVCCAPKIEA